MSDVMAVEFECQVRQVKSMADHSVNITLNLPEYAIEQASWFMKHIDDAVKIIAVLSESEP
jgi:hypothetical protein